MRTAVGVLVRFSATTKRIVQTSTSLTQFEHQVVSAFENPKVKKAEGTWPPTSPTGAAR